MPALGPVVTCQPGDIAASDVLTVSAEGRSQRTLMPLGRVSCACSAPAAARVAKRARAGRASVIGSLVVENRHMVAASVPEGYIGDVVFLHNAGFYGRFPYAHHDVAQPRHL